MAFFSSHQPSSGKNDKEMDHEGEQCANRRHPAERGTLVGGDNSPCLNSIEPPTEQTH